MDRRPTAMPTAMRPRWCSCTAGRRRTRRWIERAILCFDQALTDIGVADDAPLRQVLHDYFVWTTSVSFSRVLTALPSDVPIGLVLPHWSWSGLEG